MSESHTYQTHNEPLIGDSVTSGTSISNINLSGFVNDTIQRAKITEPANIHVCMGHNVSDNHSKSFVEKINFQSNDLIGDAIDQLHECIDNDTDGSVKEAMLELRAIIQQQKAKYTRMKEILEHMEKEREIKATLVLSNESLQSCRIFRELFFQPGTEYIYQAGKDTQVAMLSPSPLTPTPEPAKQENTIRTTARGLKASICGCFQCCVNPCAEDEMDPNFVLDYDSD